MFNTNYFISAESLQMLLDDDSVVIIDTRNPDAFNAGHIQNAVNIHDFFTYLARESEGHYPDLCEHFTEVLGKHGVQADQMIVLYEDNLNNGYGQSCRGWVILSALGHPRMRVLYGGFAGWKLKDLPVTSTETKISPTQYLHGNDINSLLIDKKNMLDALNNRHIKILDTRNEDEWIGDSSSPYGRDFAPRKGRIPGAAWMQWDNLMTQDGAFLPTENVLAMMKQLGISRSDDIYLYCFKGARASHTLLALKMAGFDRVKLYFGSWNEWSRDDRLPIDNEVIVTTLP